MSKYFMQRKYRREYNRLCDWLRRHHPDIWEEYKRKEDEKMLKILLKEYEDNRESLPKVEA